MSSLMAANLFVLGDDVNSSTFSLVFVTTGLEAAGLLAPVEALVIRSLTS